MRSAQRLKDLGVPSWFHQHARYYERLLTNVGWNGKQIDEAIKFGASWQGGTEEELTRAFRELAEYHDVPDLDMAIDVGLGLRDSITNEGIESLPAIEGAEPAFTSADEARLAAIREIARNDPHAYEALQDEHTDLLEAQQAAGGKVSSSNANASAPPGGDRLAQIREMRRNDPSAYDRDSARLEAEELSLIEQSLPKSAPVSTGTDGAASIQPASEGTAGE